MLKNLTFLAITGMLAGGCIITTGGTDSDSTSSNTSSNTSTAGTTTDNTTSGSTSGGTGSATGSSGEPVTTTSPTSGTSEPATSSSGSSGGGSEYGNCGWNAAMKYYGCDGDPGVSDPDGISPIDCPDPLPAMGDKCDDTTPVNNVGCCLPDGTNYYCDADGMVQLDMCG